MRAGAVGGGAGGRACNDRRGGCLPGRRSFTCAKARAARLASSWRPLERVSPGYPDLLLPVVPARGPG